MSISSVWLVLQALSLVLLVFFPYEADYAELSPPPDEVVWEVGDETTVWLSTNRHAVDVQIDSIDLGLGTMRRLGQSGEPVALGESTGCVDSGVASILVDNITATGARVTVTVDYGSHTFGDRVRLYYRRYADGVKDLTLGESGALLDVPSTGSLTRAYTYGGLRADVTYRFEASMDSHFPRTTTRYVEWTQAADAEDVYAGGAEEELHLPAADAEGAVTGIGLIGCHEHEDVLVTLHGDEGKELARYLVDVLPAPTPDPNVPPAFHTAAATRCATKDASGTTVVMAPGDEVGSTIQAYDPDQDESTALSYALEGTGAKFFTVASDHVEDDDTTLGDELRFQAQLSVKTGVRLLSNIDYMFSLVATDSAGATGSVAVTVNTDLAGNACTEVG